MSQTKSALYRVTPRAKEDLINIARYTEASWGRAQRNLYLKQLEQRFAWLAANPHLGKARPEKLARRQKLGVEINTQHRLYFTATLFILQALVSGYRPFILGFAAITKVLPIALGLTFII
ncbi:MAG: hypothetical protein B7Z18_08720 [Alishewanella sp. 32-51-5]|nr:MAG: hypothetical protein B7Z18_08720 [Alishewanella sp. 32-51-5]